MPHAAKNTMAYATSEKCVSVDTRQNAKDEQDRRDESTCELGGLFPGVHRVNIEVPTRNGDGCSCVRGARSPCWTSRNEGQDWHQQDEVR